MPIITNAYSRINPDNTLEIEYFVTLSKIYMVLNSKYQKALGKKPSLRKLTVFILLNCTEVSDFLSEKICEGCKLKKIDIEAGDPENPNLMLIFTFQKPTS